MGGINVRISDDNGGRLNLDGEHSVPVVVHPHPPEDEAPSGAPLPFRQRFTDDGTSSGTSDMTVDGSTNSQDFWIGAEKDKDIYIMYLSAIIGDGGSPALNKFGELAALANGVEWAWFTNEEGEYTLHDGIKTNLEFIRLGNDSAGFGDGNNAFLADVSGGGTEKSYLPSIAMKELFGLQWGLRLKKGTEDKLIFRINDDLTALTTFDVIAYGIRF